MGKEAVTILTLLLWCVVWQGSDGCMLCITQLLRP